MKKLVFLLLVLYSFACPIYSQIDFDPHIVDGTGRAELVYPADADGDGDTDLFVYNNNFEEIAYWVNQGGVFTSKKTIENKRNLKALHAIDLNEDGYVDLLASHASFNELYFWSNHEEGFSEGSLIYTSPSTIFQINTGDVDNDGDSDILLLANSIIWLENTEDNSFVEHIIEERFLGRQTISLVDLDKNGSNEIITAGDGGVILYIYNANSTFTKKFISSSNDKHNMVKAHDMDNDGDLDIVAANSRGYIQDQNFKWFENNGELDFTGRVFTSLRGIPIRDFSILHIDNDSLPDVFVMTDQEPNVFWLENRINENQLASKNSIFEKICNVTLGSGSNQILKNADLDQDGDQDIIMVHEGREFFSWWENQNGGTFFEHQISSGLPSANDLIVIDMNMDGELDFLVSSDNGGKGDVPMLYEKQEHLYRRYEMSCGTEEPFIIRATDFNQDGLTDVFVGYSFAWRIHYLKNQGGNIFSDRYFDSYNPSDPGLITEDLNNDGNEEVIFVTRYPRRLQAFEYNEGEIVEHIILEEGLPPLDEIQSIDFNGDGLTDIIGINSESNEVFVLLNNGDFEFSQFNDSIPIPEGIDGIYDTEYSDINGDNFIDLFSVVEKDGENFIVLLINKSNQEFIEYEVSEGFANRNSKISIGDIDGDGNIDLATLYINERILYLNNGQNQFTQQILPEMSDYFVRYKDIICVDVNKDNALDLITIGFGDVAIIWWENIGKTTGISPIPPFNKNGLKITPNPSQSFIHISAEDIRNFDRIRIYDHQGRFILEKRNSGAEVSTSTLPNGLYIVVAYHENSYFTGRFVKTE